jgi:hypothetical protein
VDYPQLDVDSPGYWSEADDCLHCVSVLQVSNTQQVRGHTDSEEHHVSVFHWHIPHFI